MLDLRWIMLKRCLFLLKLIETGECKYSKCLDEFINSGLAYRKNNRVIADDIDYLKNFFSNHCSNLVEKYYFLASKNIYPKDSKSLENAYKLYMYLNKNKVENRDLRHISTVVFGNSKILLQSNLLRKVVDIFFEKSDKIIENYFNIIHLRSNNKVCFAGEDITNIIFKNGFFSCFSSKIIEVKADLEYVVIFENLSPFFKLNPENSLFIYAGGFQNISEISRALKEFNFKQIVHFGDVDPSGLMIADILLSHNKSADFYPDLETIRSVNNMIDKPIFAEKEYDENTLKSQMLKEISNYMKKSGNYRIEQEMVVAFMLQNKIKIPYWCSIV
jgi:hypothetical protein